MVEGGGGGSTDDQISVKKEGRKLNKEERKAFVTCRSCESDPLGGPTADDRSARGGETRTSEEMRGGVRADGVNTSILVRVALVF